MNEDYSESEGVRVSYEEVTPEGGIEQVPPARPAKRRRPVKEPCPYCRKSFRALWAHSPRCPKKPKEVAAEAIPPKEEKAEEVKVEVIVILTPEVLGAGIATLFDLVSVRAGKHWRLDPLEANALGTTWHQVLEAYVPNLTRSKHGLLLLALLQTSALIGSKIYVGKEEERTSHDSRQIGKREDGPTASATD